MIQWECRTFPEAPIQVMRREGEEQEVVLDHPMIQLLRHPNPFYGGVNLWMATLADWLATGNAYWVKQRSAGNRVVTLWWVPSSSIEPAWPDDGRTFISHYTYTPGTMSQDIAVADVVHFRYGMDPVNIRKGLSPLASLAREIFTDNEAANWTASLLRNGAVPSVVVSPGTDEAEFENPAEIKTVFSQEFGGDNRGGVVVMNGKTQVEPLGFNPQQMNLRDLRRIPEERVTAIFGPPAVIVGLGAGLERSTYNNMSEAREHAYEGVIIPHQRLFAEQLETQLLVEFDDITRASIAFDYSNIRVLQEDVNNLHARAREDWKAGVLTLNQTLALLGEEQLAGPEGDVRFIPISGVITPADALIIEIPEPVAPPPMAEEPEEEEEAPLRAVATRGTAELKAPSQFGPGVLRLRTRLVAGAVPDIQAFLAGEAARVVAALRAEMKVDGGDVFDADAEAQALRAVLDPWYRRALESVSDLTQFALGISFEIDDPLTRAYLAQCGDLITNITSTTQQAIQQALVAGQAEGESYQQLARRIRGLPAFNAQRAELVARTELGASTNHATMLSFTRSGVVVGVEFTDGDEHEPCASINGRIMGLEEARSVPVLFHPNCLVGSTMVLAPSELHAAYERPFEGEVVVLRTADDRLLTCTPNHPILSTHGWIAAGSLRQGDYVIGSSGREGIRWAASYPDNDERPAPIQQVTRALGPAVGGSTTRMPSAAIDFHGDGLDGEVYVVRTNGLRQDRRLAAQGEQFGELAFKGTDMRLRALFAEGAFAEVDLVATHATDGMMSGARLSSAAFRTDPLLPRSGSLVRRAERVALLDQPTPQAAAGYAELSTQNLGTLAGLVAPIEVVSVERVQFAGQVYNLETADGWYLAEGIVTHNCTQARSPVTDVRELPKARTNGHVKEAVLH